MNLEQSRFSERLLLFQRPWLTLLVAFLLNCLLFLAFRSRSSMAGLLFWFGKYWLCLSVVLVQLIKFVKRDEMAKLSTNRQYKILNRYFQAAYSFVEELLQARARLTLKERMALILSLFLAAFLAQLLPLWLALGLVLNGYFLHKYLLTLGKDLSVPAREWIQRGTGKVRELLQSMPF